MKTYFKYGSILACAIIAFFLFRGCNNGGEVKQITIVDTVTKTDTFWKEIVSDSEYILHEEVRYRDRETVLHDTLEITEIQPVDSARILRQYFATRSYTDTLKPEGLRGYILIHDEVSQNRITKRTLKERFSTPETVITKTITTTKPTRTTLYVGTEINGNKEYPLYSIGVNAGFLLKNGKYWGLQYSLTKEGNPLYGVRFMLPIKTRK